MAALFLLASVQAQQIRDAVSVSVVPPSIKLAQPSKLGSPSSSSGFGLRLYNGLKEKAQFNNFYGGWRVMLLDDSGSVVARPFVRRLVRSVNRDRYFPMLAPATSISSNAACYFLRQGSNWILRFVDGANGHVDFSVQPGRYAFCVLYHPPEDQPPLPKPEPYPPIDLTKIWSGWAVSNWVQLELIDNTPTPRR